MTGLRHSPERAGVPLFKLRGDCGRGTYALRVCEDTMRAAAIYLNEACVIADVFYEAEQTALKLMGCH